MTQLNIAARQGFVSDIASVESRAIDVARILNSMISRLSTYPPTPTPLLPKPYSLTPTP